MKVQLIPENEAETNLLKDFEHEGVQDVFVFGNKVDENGEIKDFHFWKGNYRYLIGSLNFFYNEINDERRVKNEKKMEGTQRLEMRWKSKGMKKRGTTIGKPEIIEVDDFGTPPPGFDLLDGHNH